MERVVVTGIGLVSCLGPSLSAVSQKLRGGQSGIVLDRERQAMGFRSALTGRIVGFDPRRYLTRKDLRSMGEPATYAAHATFDALGDAAIPRGATGGPRWGVILGNDSSCGSAVRAADQTRADGTTRNLGSGAVVECMTSSPSINLSVLLRSQGACWTIASACSSGAHAVGQAWGLLALGQQDVVICGGAQEMNWSSMTGFDAISAFSTWPGDPAMAVRPFSRDRDGLVPSGGAAVLVLETLSHALARGARIRAEVLSYAFTSDGFHITTPSGTGAARCIRDALARARVSPAQIEYVNAHAAGTPVGDAVEARAILDVFGSQCPPVSSTKSLTGHECWMAGASEIAYSLLMAEGGFLAPNRNFTAPDDGCEALNVVKAPTDRRFDLFLSNSFGFGGTNACVVLRSGEPWGTA